MAWETLSELGVEWKRGEVVATLAEGGPQVVEAGMKVRLEQRGSEAEKPPFVLLVGAGVRGSRGEAGGNEKERRMRQGMEEPKEAGELLERGKSQGGELEKQNEIKVFVSHEFINACFILEK